MSPAATRRRDPYLDNVKAILIVLVVVGHAVAPVAMPLESALYAWVYSFHMPAFVLVSGYLSRRFTLSRQSAGGLVAQLLVPYLVFTLIQAAQRALLHGSFEVDPLLPGWTLWFLLALFWWRLATPLLRRLPSPVLLVGSVGVSLTASLGDGVPQWLAVGRTLSFLPFFALGLLLTPEHVAAIRRPVGRTVAVTVGALGVLTVFLVLLPLVPSTALQLSVGSAALQLGTGPGVLVRLLTLGIGLAGSAAVLALAPRGRHWWTDLGRHSLTIYLLHAVVLYPLRTADHLVWVDSVPELALAVLLAVALAAVLGSGPVVRATRWLVQPPLPILTGRRD